MIAPSNSINRRWTCILPPRPIPSWAGRIISRGALKRPLPNASAPSSSTPNSVTLTVVRVTEFGVELDGALAFGNGLFNAPLEMIRPAQEGMGLGGRMQVQRRLIEFDGAIIVAFHLRLVGVLQDFPCLREGLHAHGA